MTAADYGDLYGRVGGREVRRRDLSAEGADVGFAVATEEVADEDYEVGLLLLLLWGGCVGGRGVEGFEREFSALFVEDFELAGAEEGFGVWEDIRVVGAFSGRGLALHATAGVVDHGGEGWLEGEKGKGKGYLGCLYMYYVRDEHVPRWCGV